ncbi:MAG: radical SAM protein [Candidatus Heimdallarchaeota archaeon]
MKEKIRTLEGGSLLKGELPEGCKICRRGAELFFFITGKCSESCFYCSLAGAKRGKSLILANERPVKNFANVMIEATNMNALGAAVTGGDPLLCIDTTIEYIRKMKEVFGKKFHIHLYTSGRYATEENLSKLFQAGLDEIRFHPQNDEQRKAIAKALTFDWQVGAEIPVIPGTKKETLAFLDFLESLGGVSFCNLNELEATETNLPALKEHGFELVNQEGAAIKGSKELAKKLLLETNYSYTLHFCSAKTKDAVQFRNRLIRTANNIRKPYEEVQDGMLVKAVIEIPKTLIGEEVLETLAEEYEVDPELIALPTEDRLETAWFIADALKEVLKERFEITGIFVTYEYPTFQRTLIAKIPLLGEKDSSAKKQTTQRKKR